MTPSGRTVIADATVLIFIDQLRLTDLLRQLYDRLLVPELVRDEIERGRQKGDPGPDIARLPWIEVRAVPPASPELKRFRLHAGEAAVLSLALSLRPLEVYVLMDDREGRAAAASLGIDRTGILGVLVEAKTAHLIPSVKPHFQHLVAAGFWINPAVLESALDLAGESLEGD